MAQTIKKKNPDGTVTEFVIGKATDVPESRMKVEVGRGLAEKDLQGQIDVLRETLRGVESERDDYRDKITARDLSEFEGLKERAKSIAQSKGENLNMQIFDTMNVKDGTSGLEEYIRKNTPTGERGIKPTDVPQGSVVQLNPPRVKGGNPGEYETYSDMIDDLYAKAYKRDEYGKDIGDPYAKKQLDRLWTKLETDLVGMRSRSEQMPVFNLSRCTTCWSGPVIDGICRECGADQNA